MPHFRSLLSSSVLLLCFALPLPLSAHKAGDRVLGKLNDGPYWFAAKVTAVEGDKISLEYGDGAKETTTSEKLLEIGTIRAGTAVQCNWKGKGSYYNGWVTAISGEKVSVRYVDGDKEKTTLDKCRLRDAQDDSDRVRWACLAVKDYEALKAKHSNDAKALTSIESPFHSFGNMCFRLSALQSKKSELPAALFEELNAHPEDPAVNAMRFQKAKYQTYAKTTKLPKARMPAMQKKLHVAARAAWETSDIGDRAVVMKCVVTSAAWTSWKSADAVTGRSVNGSCVVQVATNVCVIFHDGCREEHLGLGQYGACEYQAYETTPAELIDCAKVAK